MHIAGEIPFLSFLNFIFLCLKERRLKEDLRWEAEYRKLDVKEKETLHDILANRAHDTASGFIGEEVQRLDCAFFEIFLKWARI